MPPTVLKNFRKMFKKMPRIVSVSQTRQKTLVEGQEGPPFFYLPQAAEHFVQETQTMLTDHEVKLLLIWALVAPSAGLAYLVWVKYPKLRGVAFLLSIISIIQFLGQWGGVLWLAYRFFGM